MPKEQPHSSEQSLGGTSSKNAKDKSNSTTLLAIRNTKDEDSSSGRGSRCSSEKDSGYSDGSDCQQTDVEDQWNNKSKSRGSERAESSKPGLNQQPGSENPANPSLMPAAHEISPIYIINNMVPKQPDVIQKRGPLPRRNGSRESGGTGPAHMILLQQPSLVLATLQLQRQSSHKNSATGKKINGTYLPILNSYQRIAPHPGKKPPDKFSSNDKSQNLSKRVCTEHKSEDTPIKRSQPEEHLSKPPKIAPSSGLLCSYLTKDGLSSSSPSTVSSSQGSPSGSSIHTTSSPLSIRGSHRNSSTSARNRRFLNTVEILQQSGLWDITLRTKELLRQSNATERDLAQLRQHTEQLCQAYSNRSCSLNGITAWEHVHRSMAESGSYPNLKILQDLQTPSHPNAASQPESISTSDTHGPLSAESSEGPPPQLLTTITNPNQNYPGPELSHSRHSKELVAGNHASEKVTFMPPDSSTS